MVEVLLQFRVCLIAALNFCRWANLITLCHCPCVRRQQVFVLFVLMRPKYCALISGALPTGGAVGCEDLVREQGVDCKLLNLRILLLHERLLCS